MLTFGSAPTAPGAASTAAAYLSALYGGVDGVYSESASQIKMLVGVGSAGTFQHMGSVFRANASDDNVASLYARLSGGLRASKNVPAYAGNKQNALIIRGPARRNAVASTWRNIELIVDRVTKANAGIVVITAIMLQDHAILREDGFVRHYFRTS